MSAKQCKNFTELEKKIILYHANAISNSKKTVLCLSGLKMIIGVAFLWMSSGEGDDILRG
jgi:hypothetical protein